MRKLKWRLRGTNVTSLSHQTLSAPTQENIYSSKPQTEVQSRNCSTPWQHVKVGERERRNDRIRTYRSCIQHKNLEIVRNPEVAFWSWFDTIISFKNPPNYFTRDPLRSIGNKPIRVKFLTLHGCQVRLLTVRYACIQEFPFSSAKG